MYIFGYGSLINPASRALTGQTGQAIPAIARGLVRYWGKVDDSYHHSPLVVAQGEGNINGVLLAIDERTLMEFDRREQGYQRIALPSDQICAQSGFDRNQPIWVYIKERHEPPCSKIPVMQTYVDTVLAGCLEISESFAKRFVESTLGWHFPRENDRAFPKYNNLAGVTAAHHAQIDDLLKQFYT